MSSSSSLILLVLAFPLFVFAQGPYYQAPVDPDPESIKNTRKSYQTLAIQSEAPHIDGIIDDAVWSTVEWGGDFIQSQPDEGKLPAQQTSFKILYDDKNIYIAYRCHDTQPDKIVRRLSRRDGFSGDWVEINIDSYHDLQTAFSFTITAAGVKGDEAITQNGNNWDTNWNPIWYAKTNIDDKGWTAEVRIPLSQLRYSNEEEQTWGIQFTRRDFREEQRSIWQFKARTTPGWVSNFGLLTGIKGIKTQKQVEIQPYVVLQTENFEKEAGNPFADGSRNRSSVGLDGKLGLTSDFTLDFTVNPDFGQVEADPSAVTLDGFQIFFSERRPFFIENRDLFEYRLSSAEAGGPFTSDLLFYSRRIGGSPHGFPSSSGFVNQPDFTSILGAAKVSGKSKNGLSMGILSSITAQESAEIDLDGVRSKEIVEPLTSYFVGRIQQDINDANTIVGGMLTAVNRRLDNTGLDFLHKSAYSGAFNFEHWWKDREWFFKAKTYMSHVRGSEEAILQTQTSFEHLFQRPDADHLEVDPHRTSLTGTGGVVKMGNYGGDWIFESGITWRSPYLELNDVGFQRNSDYATHFFWGGYRHLQPQGILNNWRVNYNHWLSWDFGGTNTYKAINVNAHAELKSQWGGGLGLHMELYDVSNSALRGGPAMRGSEGINIWHYIYSDSRKKLNGFINPSIFRGFQGQHDNIGLGGTLRYQPTNTIDLSVSPRYNYNDRRLQYVSTQSMDGERRYINGRVKQKTLSMSVRLNYTIRPNLSLQYWGQPFISQGRYSEFKKITNPLASTFTDRYELFDPTQATFDEDGNNYSIDEDRDGQVDYSFNNPDFGFIQFRSNLVARWEYIPGSEVFLVWSQGITSFGDPQDNLIPSLRENLSDEVPHNIFLIKLTYRFLN